jgi:hypothetical protein
MKSSCGSQLIMILQNITAFSLVEMSLILYPNTALRQVHEDIVTLFISVIDNISVSLLQ